MKRDIDRLMAERRLDAVVVLGDTLASPTVYYLTGGVKLENATIILRPGRPGILVHSPIERDGAALTGLQPLPYTHWDVAAIRQAAAGDHLAADVELVRQILAEFDVRGRVGFYGHGEIGRHHALLGALAATLPDTEIVVEYADSLFTAARITKDENELRMMQDIGRRTCEVVAAVADFLSSRPLSDATLLAPDGQPLTVGAVKRFVRHELARRGLEEPGEHIFALGADAGVPHNSGNPADVLTLGAPIIFDIFPRPLGGGYYHDVTRTWCLGHAPAPVEQAHTQVMASFDLVTAALQVGRATADYQALVCEFFESQGHASIASDPKTETGFVHSLGHGLGLEVHEDPRFTTLAGYTDTLQPGAVFTIEPGLYYPQRGYGVRIEDTYYCGHDGAFHSMTPFPKDLVLPVRG